MSSSTPGELRYLALGDSYTIGEGIAPGARWPVRLAAALRAEGVPVSDPRIIATTGWTTDELSSAIDAAEPLGAWDLVSLLIGVNNQYRGRGVADYAVEFTGLLDRAIAFARHRPDRVLVLGIPDWGVTPFGVEAERKGSHRDVSAQIDAFNATAQTVCEAREVAFVDITAASRADPRQVADDGLHPSAAMHATWVRAALPAARGLLAR